jgi:hypothetical protein
MALRSTDIFMLLSSNPINLIYPGSIIPEITIIWEP